MLNKQKTNPQIPQIRLAPSTVHTYRNLILLSKSLQCSWNCLWKTYDLQSISGTTRADTVPIVFTVMAPTYVCSQRKVGGQEYVLNLF